MATKNMFQIIGLDADEEKKLSTFIASRPDEKKQAIRLRIFRAGMTQIIKTKKGKKS